VFLSVGVVLRDEDSKEEIVKEEIIKEVRLTLED
jgi:hypothetical protein